MFLKKLTISKQNQTIREIAFRNGINLIVDETPSTDDKATGNNVGKTTVLKLIDFCLGADPKIVYIDPESKNVYLTVKNFLIDNEILITLTLKENLEVKNSSEITIERNFLSRKKKIQKINGENLTGDEFESKLLQELLSEYDLDKPTFRQIISHNIRYSDENINNTLKTLDKYTTDAEYETLYLYMLGCEFKRGNLKQEILEKIKQENNYKIRLERQQTKNAYEVSLSLINSEINDLNKKKNNLNLNKNFEADLDNLNKIKYEINRISSDINKITIRRDLIIEAENALNSRKSNIDLQQLNLIYKQATNQIDGIQKTFGDLVEYHNKMIIEKIKFIKKELPEIENNIQSKQFILKKKLDEESKLSLLITKSSSFEELENIIMELNERFRKKGEYESTIQQLEEVENNIRNYTHELDKIDDELFSQEFETTVKNQLNKFNQYFSMVSNQLYGEKYAIKYEIHTNKRKQRLYKFNVFNAFSTNISSGKKQGEISCFDIAYTLFADEENISCLHFLLNDKKELLYDNQLVIIADLVNKNNIQFVASILKDKLPDALKDESNFAVKLSQKDKLFRIEN